MFSVIWLDLLNRRFEAEVEQITESADGIFTVLQNVFGAGEDLSTLQQKFYTYRQQEKQSLLECSLELVNLYNRMCRLDPSLETRKLINATFS